MVRINDNQPTNAATAGQLKLNSAQRLVDEAYGVF